MRAFYTLAILGGLSMASATECGNVEAVCASKQLTKSCDMKKECRKIAKKAERIAAHVSDKVSDKVTEGLSSLDDLKENVDLAAVESNVEQGLNFVNSQIDAHYDRQAEYLNQFFAQFDGQVALMEETVDSLVGEITEEDIAAANAAISNIFTGIDNFVAEQDSDVADALTQIISAEDWEALKAGHNDQPPVDEVLTQIRSERNEMVALYKQLAEEHTEAERQLAHATVAEGKDFLAKYDLEGWVDSVVEMVDNYSEVAAKYAGNASDFLEKKSDFVNGLIDSYYGEE